MRSIPRSARAYEALPAHAAPPRPDLLLGDAPAARATSGPPRTRSTATCARPTRSSTARAAPPTPEARRAALDAWEAELERGLRRGQLAAAGGRRARRRRPPPRPAARRAAAPTCARCGSTAAPVRIASRRRARRATWTARPARSGGSWRRCSACPERTTTSFGAARAGVPADELHPRRARGLAARPHLPARPRTRALRRREADSPRGDARAARAVADEVGARARAVRERRARRSPPRPRSVRPGDPARRARSTCGVLDRVEAHRLRRARPPPGAAAWRARPRAVAGGARRR